MGLASFLSRLSKPEHASGPAEEERLRTQARHRLIGAALLVMLAVLLLPWVFDSPPRPLPGDLPIDIPRREAVAALGLPSERAAVPVAASAGSAPDAAPEPQTVRSAPTPPAPARPAAATAMREAVEAAVPPRRAASSAALPRALAASAPIAPQPVPAPASRSAETRPGTARPAAETVVGARYIVQIGAYADPSTARAARLKVERLGLKTYVHEIEVPGGKRIRVRVGPYSDRDEAASVRDRLEKAGFQPGLLTL